MDTKDRVIGEYKARKVGNATVITIPSSLDVKVGEKFLLKVSATGDQIILEREKSSNPWENGQFADFDFRQDIAEVGNYANGKDIGKENVEW
ncbi:hypothetical protein [Lacticaseibacillus hegangensis]|uniref:AbrB family transcriptional regulator n=1 Tax=Lacticaseibacillus hegangensis TaxID=2486010 RepID=A0ABW4D0A4_9LACO|nr:hypothetical protein [Lacticaseibacillus hegangensis]